MLVENEKVGINSHQWPQEPILLSTTTATFTTAPSSTAAPAAAMVHHQDHSSAPTAAALKCPRCDSSNTKFCYYNNYSLSQPRHFCKACKRYWTRGGTLRNVPVGGGCRKNTKRRPQNKPSSSSSVPAVSSSSPSPLNPPTSLPNIAPPAAETSNLFYNMPTAADMSLAFPSLRPYDVQPQLDALSGLGFTSAQFGAEINQLSDYQQFGSLLASSLRPPNKSDQHYQSSLLPYEDPQANGNLGLMKEVKVEGDYSSIMTTNRVEEWQLPSNDNPYETLAAAADHSSSCLYWNVPGWPDATAANCGSSIAPLI